jgi:hypothetical protein
MRANQTGHGESRVERVLNEAIVKRERNSLDAEDDGRLLSLALADASVCVARRFAVAEVNEQYLQLALHELDRSATEDSLEIVRVGAERHDVVPVAEDRASDGRFGAHSRHRLMRHRGSH